MKDKVEPSKERLKSLAHMEYDKEVERELSKEVEKEEPFIVPDRTDKELMDMIRPSRLGEKTEWISVKDKLPNYWDWVVLYRDGNQLTPYIMTRWSIEEFAFMDKNQVTHWKSLAPPIKD